MSLKGLASETIAKLEKSFPDYTFTAEQKDEIEKLVEGALRKSVEEAARAHREATLICCGSEADIAHKIAEEAKKRTDSIVSNLMALR